MGRRAYDRITKRAKPYPKVSNLEMIEALRKAHKRLGIIPKNFHLKYSNKRKPPTQTQDVGNITTNKSA